MTVTCPSKAIQAVPVGRAATQPAVPADRFAREIIGILAAYAVRLRRLNGNPLGGWGNVVAGFFLVKATSLGCARRLCQSRRAACPLCRCGSIARGADCPWCSA
jgi:hypothetical protein